MMDTEDLCMIVCIAVITWCHDMDASFTTLAYGVREGRGYFSDSSVFSTIFISIISCIQASGHLNQTGRG